MFTKFEITSRDVHHNVLRINEITIKDAFAHDHVLNARATIAIEQEATRARNDANWAHGVNVETQTVTHA